MKAIHRHIYGDEIIDIFGIYWGENEETIFFGLTQKHNYQYAYSADEVDIIDSNINFRAIYISNGSLTGIFHWALVEKNLLDEIIDGDTELREKFLEIVRSEKVIDW